jgi:hypothetical protein
MTLTWTVITYGGMATDCCDSCHSADPHRGDRTYRRILWAVLAINAAMFLVEIGAGLAVGSASLEADALDFLGDAANYSISLFAVGGGWCVRSWELMASLALQGAARVISRSLAELRETVSISARG